MSLELGVVAPAYKAKPSECQVLGHSKTLSQQKQKPILRNLEATVLVH